MIKKIFVSGLITFLPIAATIYIIIIGVNLIENILGYALRNILPEGFYFPGYGFVATLIIIFICGLLVNNIITAALVKKFQEKITSIPIVNAVYSPLRDLINLFSKSQNGNSPRKVVLAQLSANVTALGLVTREDFDDLGFNDSSLKDSIAVLFPMSYGLGGYTLIINKKNIQPVNMSVEKAMRLSVTGWVTTDTHKL